MSKNGMPRYTRLPNSIHDALQNIPPSDGGDIMYYPCRVVLKSGLTLDTVYIEPEKPYLRAWGIYPEDDKAKRSVRIEDVVKAEDSPTKLPFQFANEIYRNGESGMGYTIFTVVFSDGQRQACSTGNAVDFISYPDGKGPRDVVAVVPHEGKWANIVSAPEWYWCLYSDEEE
jgi:hypothetical protein